MDTQRSREIILESRTTWAGAIDQADNQNVYLDGTCTCVALAVDSTRAALYFIRFLGFTFSPL